MLALSFLLCQAPFVFAQSGGLPPEWEVRQMLGGFVTQAKRLPPLLEQVKPREWKDASPTYAEQLKATQAEVGYLVRTAESLAAQPERLTLALETLFRMQAVEAFVGSLSDGIRRHQNPAVADLLRGVLDENAANREKLRHYITDLATAKEQELAVADKEAQRCRGMISRQPPAPPRNPEKKKQ